ncbi:hypothetical protein [Streptomyces albidus (ex Kaewkla and Franco 2022)]|uniref:SCO2583 family membrane protein n=1 Tax=Streptomyces albidus (ex Kaewkla and Franco 2022) TaxID=722709 RepID=UPI0015EEF5C6|nr:hypothetical protein [Streptomyces albidus (ex Kaewkla and Franco 2022)]
MAGRGNPPEGTPDDASGGDDEYRDDYRSVVFDESFIKAAQLQEYSAQERMEDEEHAAVRSRASSGPGAQAVTDEEADVDGPAYERSTITASRQGIVLVLLIVLAFGTAIYMGIRNPYQTPSGPPVEPLRSSLLPLAPREAVPGATPTDLFEHSPAAEFRTGADGVTLPAVRRTVHFSESQVLSALTAAKDYVVESSLDPAVLTGNSTRTVRIMLDPAQQAQFDQSMDKPRNDGRHSATGWMIRFDPSRTALADSRVRVSGTMTVQESGADALEVVADHVFVYAVRAPDAGEGKNAESHSSLFTVRREVRFQIDREDLRRQQLSVRQVSMRAGPLPCSADVSGVLAPLLAGEKAKDDGPAGTDPYARGRAAASLCGVLSTSAQPSPADPSE